MAHRRLLALSVIACAVAAGCADKPEPPGPPSPERVQRCLSEREDLHGRRGDQTGPIGPLLSSDGGAAARIQAGIGTLCCSHRRRAAAAPSKRTRASQNAPWARPSCTSSLVAPRPQDAADTIEPVVGSPDDSVFNGARVLGPALVLHYSFGMGDNPGGVGIQEDIEPVEACMREAGYL